MRALPLPLRPLRARTRRSLAASAGAVATLPRWAEYTQRGGEGVPLVVLVSWLGARKEHVDRYADLYAQRGLSTLTLVPPLCDSLLPACADRATERLLAALPAHPGGTLLHVASHGGYLFLSNLLRAAAAGQPRACELVASTRGLLLDSAPLMQLDSDVAARALASILLRTRAVEGASEGQPKKATVFHASLTLGLRLALDATFSIPQASSAQCVAECQCWNSELSVLLYQVGHRLAQLRAAWDSPAVAPSLSRVPTALLFSAGDALVPAAGIQAWAEERRTAGWAKLRMQPFPAACPHVELLRFEPAAYGEAVDCWLRSALAVL